MTTPSTFETDNSKSASRTSPDEEAKLTSIMVTAPPTSELIEQEEGAKHTAETTGLKTVIDVDVVREFVVRTRL
jgi:hypothetical protein